MRPSDITKTMQALYSSGVPIYLWGPPGVGKSSLIKAAAVSLEVEFLDIRGLLHDPSDLKFPMVDPQSRQLTWINSLFPKDPKWRGIIVLEELALCPPLMQGAFLQVTLDRRIGDYILPPDAWVVAASNRAEDRAGANRIITPLLNRFIHLDLEVSNEDWGAWALQSGVRPEVRAFLNFKPALLHDFDPASHRRAFPTPRSWERVSDIFPRCPRELLHPVVSGCVGEGPAAEFVAFTNVYGQLPSVSEILAKPETAPVPSRALDVMHALCGALTERCREADAPTLTRLISYLMRLPDEFAILCGRDTILLNPLFLRAPKASEYLKKHRNVLVEANAA